MDELYDIMNDFLEVEFKIATFEYIYENMKETYRECSDIELNKKNKECMYIVNSAQINFKMVYSEINTAINKLDEYLANV